MARSMTGEMTIARQLDAAASREVLADAIDVRAPVQLWTDRDTYEPIVEGVISGGSELTLAIETLDTDHMTCEVDESAVLHATIDLEGARYGFETSWLGHINEGKAKRLRLCRPPIVAVLERRRSRRRCFRERAEITLCSQDSADAWCCRAVLLNISLEGLAGRVQVEDAKMMAAEQMLHATFSLVGSSRAFDLATRVVSLTQAGTPRSVVVGMEFIDDGNLEANRERLREALGE